MPPRRRSWQERAEPYIERLPDMPGCWIWTGSTAFNDPTYAKTNIGSERFLVHRLMLEQKLGRPIKPGLVVDHLCNLSLCVNPEHLRETTQRENVLRGAGPSALHARKTTCPKKHAYDYVSPSGRRGCSICRAAAVARHNTRKGDLLA